jgi:hypothetical protein
MGGFTLEQEIGGEILFDMAGAAPGYARVIS